MLSNRAEEGAGAEAKLRPDQSDASDCICQDQVPQSLRLSYAFSYLIFPFQSSESVSWKGPNQLTAHQNDACVIRSGIHRGR